MGKFNWAKKFVVLGGVLVLAGCSAIRPEHCPYADWSATGELHASKGFDSRLPSLMDTCLAVGVLPDAQSYLAGYQRGLLGFCTIENGWVWGGNRSINPGICPPAMSQGFDRAFRTRAKLEALDIEEANQITARDKLEDVLHSGRPLPHSKLYELREIRSDLDRIDSERRRTRSGFANWLDIMGLEPPLELFNY